MCDKQTNLDQRNRTSRHVWEARSTHLFVIVAVMNHVEESLIVRLGWQPPADHAWERVGLVWGAWEQGVGLGLGGKSWWWMGGRPLHDAPVDTT